MLIDSHQSLLLSIRSDLTHVTQLSSLIAKAMELFLTVKREKGAAMKYKDVGKPDISSKINCNQHFHAKIIMIVFEQKFRSS